jgi:Coenzyme PQQ synthesis protein D (PqqD)
MALARRDEVTYEVVDDRAVLVDPEGVEIIVLNPVGTLVWQALDGTRDQAEVVAHVLTQVTGATEQEVDRDVTRFLAELDEAGLLVDRG